MATLSRRNALFGTPYLEQDGQRVCNPLWEAQSLVPVRVLGIEYRIHRKVRPFFELLIDAWQRAGVFRYVRSLDRIYEFSTNPDGIALRRHCHGNAFDVNSAFNPIGRPAHAREGGTLPLLDIARAEGWTCLADRGPVAKHFELNRLPLG